MAQAFYSIVLDHPADAVWRVIRPFGHYAWAGVSGTTVIEDGKADDQVGAIRRVDLGARTIRQVLLAHSDTDRSYRYAFANDENPFPVRDYEAVIRVTPVTATRQAFVAWSARFDCAPEERAKWVDHFEQQGFAVWLAALQRFMIETLSPPGRG